MARTDPIVRRVVAAALLVSAAWAGIHGFSREPQPSSPALLSNKCILCNAFGANHVPRICTSCNNKFSNKCILCNAFSPTQVPRICTSCNNKFSNKCILCNAFSPTQAPRICNSCNNKF
jgi:hypothetical protein